MLDTPVSTGGGEPNSSVAVAAAGAGPDSDLAATEHTVALVTVWQLPAGVEHSEAEEQAQKKMIHQ